MTRHPFAQIALNGNPKSPENRSLSCRFRQIRLLQSFYWPNRFSHLPVLHRRLFSVAVFLTLATGVSAQQQDTTPPQLVSASLGSASVDVTAAPATLTMTLGVSDDLSGTAYVCADISSPSGKQTQFNCGSLSAGTRLNGTWKINFSIPKFVESGTWTVSYVELEDQTTNLQTLNTGALTALGITTNFSVASNPDLTPPQLTSFTVRPSSIDVSNRPTSVTLTMGLQRLSIGRRLQRLTKLLRRRAQESLRASSSSTTPTST